MPVAVEALLMTGAGGLMVIVRVADPVPDTFVALMVTGVVPTALGVPLMTPVDVLTERPAGNPVAL